MGNRSNDHRAAAGSTTTGGAVVNSVRPGMRNKLAGCID